MWKESHAILSNLNLQRSHCKYCASYIEVNIIIFQYVSFFANVFYVVELSLIIVIITLIRLNTNILEKQVQNGLVAKKFKIKYLCPFSPEKERNFEDISWTANKLQDNRKKRKWIPMCAIGRRGEDTQAQKRSIGFPFKTNELNRSITIEHNE